MKKIYSIDLLKKENGTGKDNILWGNFERVHFSYAQNFVRKNDSAEDILSANRIYIYEVDSNYSLNFDTNKEVFISKISNNNYNFIGITLFSFHEDFIKKHAFQILQNKEFVVQKAREKINKEMMKKFKNIRLKFEVYGALNSYDICFICLFDDIQNMIKVIEHLQDIVYDETDNVQENKIKVFDSSYSVVTAPDLDLKEDLFKKCKGEAHIQITYDSCSSFDGLVTMILSSLGFPSLKNHKIPRGVKIFSTLGEYDISIHLPIKKLNNKLYSDILNPEKEFYKNHIQQCCTMFSCKHKFEYADKYLKKVNEEEDASHLNKSDEEEDVLHPNEIKYNSLLNHSFIKNNEYMKTICHMLKADYKKAINLTYHNNIWTEDLITQFEAIIDTIKESCDIFIDNKQEIDSLYELTSELVNLFKQTIYYIKQNNSLNLETTQSLFRNALTYDKIINSYYFIVKCILKDVYTFGDSAQSKLIPFINFEAVPIIESTLYSISNESESKILSINLPIDAFYNIKKYIPFLFHEIGHYVCPVDRFNRNIYAFIVVSTIAIVMEIQDVCKIKSQSELISEVYEIVVDEINQIEFYDYKHIFEKSWRTFFEILRKAIESTYDFTLQEVTHITEKEEDIDKDVRMFYMLVNNLRQDTLEQVRNKNPMLPDFNNAKHSKNFQYDLLITVTGVIKGIREATADTFMVEHVPINVLEYLALLIFSRYRQFLSTDETLQTEIRIGIMINALTGKKVTKICEDKRKEIYELCKQIIPNAENNLDYIEKILDDLISSYNMFLVSWSPLLNEFHKIRKTVCYEVNEETVEDDSIFNLFYSQIIKDNKLSESWLKSDIHEYLSWINLSFAPILLKDLNLSSNIRTNKEINPNIEIPRTSDNVKRFIPTFTINSPYDFNDILSQVHNIIGKKGESLWFRGQTQAEWDLKPGLFRNVKKNRYEFLLSAYHEFVAQSAESVELIGRINTDADWISYMQHYHIPTNFLDWSEQPISALYFALENYFVPPCKYLEDDDILKKCDTIKVKESKPCQKDAVIWVLNPSRMNSCLYGEENLSVLVPNLSVKTSLCEKTERFLLNESKPFDKDKFSEHEELICHIFDNYKPMAITTSRISNRLKAQKGHFIAYNINTSFDSVYEDSKIDSEHLEKAKAIEDIIQYHNYFFQKRIQYTPFLAKIIIPLNVKKEMADYVRNMGITLSSIYPELDNIGKDITNYFKSKY